MHTPPVFKKRLAAALLGGAAVLAFSAAPASATVCPAGTDPLSDYCVNNTSDQFALIVGADNPEAWFRLSDGVGATVMADDSGNFHDGEYKNEQDSGPLGISPDGSFSRDFWGENGYGYANGIPEPETGYYSWTVEAWFRSEDTDDPSTPLTRSIVNDGTIMDFGRGPSIYILSNQLRCRIGDTEIIAPNPGVGAIEDNKWYHVVCRRAGNKLRLFLQASPSSPTPFNYTPVASAQTSYLPQGAATFYIGYGAQAPWFNGQIDEVSYYRYALTDDQIAYHFYADPEPQSVKRALSGSTGDPGTSNPGTHGDDSSNPPVKTNSKAAKLKAAKADVKRLNGLVAKTKKWLGSLKHNHAKAKAVKKVRTKLAKLQKQLKRAKAKVKSLS